MPWINTEYYIETDLSDLEPFGLMSTTRYIIEGMRKVDQETVTHALPLMERAETCLAALHEVNYSLDRIYEEAKWARKVKSAAKALCEAMKELGEHVVLLVHLGKIERYSHHYPWLSRFGLRKPANVSTFSVHYDANKKHWELTCRKHASVLLFFIWEASEDGGNTWVRLGRTKTPTFTTKKLELGKQYVFRMQMSNPEGKSDYHFYNRQYATVPLPHTPVRTSSGSGSRRKKRGRRRR